MTGDTAAEFGPVVGACVWIIDLALSPSALAACDAVLSEDERVRAGRFLRSEDRDRYRASHAALRLILGRALGMDPRALTFSAGPAGKPELAGPERGVLAFNLSHSGRRALVGLSTRGYIGVDVEVIRPLPDALRIARGHFASDEADALARLPEEFREAAFFSLWTRKEAVVKALGAGLALPLDRFSVTVPPAAPRLLRMGGGPGAWTLHDLDPGPGHAATAAVMAAGIPLVRHRFPADWPSRLS
ncbi:4'-phosphopantetheinyl transferase family protein [Methylobacterium radiodurans]|uniref:4-phosphopantetheinyl transferase n=1 Tax=Methylobacterium radiodurans TaxID=2202828 RepID=A0A2U8VYR8_9HYPH|nr:4'-phosphopantetheinyl transferase superfamily protein [Methylobacterium radiodurans]AWN38236.1 4-phosphopantetheinyl transferase [Methylobacterium radiodurans]